MPVGFGLTGVRIFTKVVESPRAILIPLIIILSAVGAYAIQNNPVHITWALAFAVIGYFQKRYGYQVGPIILGVILGPMIDANYRRAMIGAKEDIGTFAFDLISNPISCALTLALVIMFVSQLPFIKRRKRRS